MSVVYLFPIPSLNKVHALIKAAVFNSSGTVDSNAFLTGRRSYHFLPLHLLLILCVLSEREIYNWMMLAAAGTFLLLLFLPALPPGVFTDDSTDCHLSKA